MQVMPQFQPQGPPVDATVGRQLLLDDHLLSESTLERVWITPAPHPENPILRPETPQDLDGGKCPVAAPFDDGLFHDAESGTWRVWYMSGWFGHTATRISRDGIDWHANEPEELEGLDLERNGHVMQRDGVSVCRDYATPDGPSFRMLHWVRERTDDFGPGDLAQHGTPVTREGGEILSSDDGVHWTYEGAAGPCGDNTTFFYDPFAGRWVFSLRTHVPPFGRARGWHAGAHFAAASTWTEDEVTPWVGSHGFGSRATVGDLPAPEIYKVTCMPYESAMLGLFAVYRGPSNDYAEAHGVPKVIDLYLGISRDGYHFSVAPEPLLSSSREDGAWDAAYLHAVNGGIVPVGEETRVYYTGFSGVSPVLGRHHYAGGSMGLATLRRDGFCALTPGASGQGRATTRELTVAGDHLFLNVETRTGELTVAVRNLATGESERLRVDPGTDSTDLGLPLTVTGPGERAAVVVNFELAGNSRLYSFWLASADGASCGFTASGPTRS